jgi:hypothetical protein
MKALQCRRGNVTLVGRDHAELFRIIEQSGSRPLNTLSERDRQLADQLHQWDLLDLVGQGDTMGYAAVTQPRPIV